MMRNLENREIRNEKTEKVLSELKKTLNELMSIKEKDMHVIKQIESIKLEMDFVYWFVKQWNAVKSRKKIIIDINGAVFRADDYNFIYFNGASEKVIYVLLYLNGEISVKVRLTNINLAFNIQGGD